MQKYAYLIIEGQPDKHQGMTFILNGKRFPDELPDNWKALSGLRVDDLLNRLGEEGWDLVAAPKFFTNREINLIFKRQLT